MENKEIVQDDKKKGPFQNELVPMIFFLGLSCVCIFGLIAVQLWGLNDLKTTILTNATSTAFAVATRQKDVSATAIIHTTEQANYEFIERFDHVSARWYVGPHNRQYGDASYSICNDSHFQIQYYDRDGWSDVTNSNSVDFIHLDDWNRIEVSARRDHFMFRINNIEVFEMTDDRLQQGSLSIYLGVPANESALVWFDNFGYQSR